MVNYLTNLSTWNQLTKTNIVLNWHL